MTEQLPRKLQLRQDIKTAFEQWLAEHCETGDIGFRETRDELYSDFEYWYQNWSRHQDPEAGLPEHISKDRFLILLGKRFPRKLVYIKGSKHQFEPYYYAIRLK